MARSITSSLLTAQSARVRKPYFHLLFTHKSGSPTRDLSSDSAAYGNRILSIEHVEEAYNDYAVIVLRNNDKGLPDLKGYWTEIGYGDVTSEGKKYAGDSGEGDSMATPRLWVKHQQNVTAAGKLYTVLELEGVWSQMRELLLLLTGGSGAPLFQFNFPDDSSGDNTVYNIIEYVIETELSWTLDAIGAESDSIIDVITFTADVESTSDYEYVANFIYRMIRLTKTFLRPRSGNVFTVLFPESGDGISWTFHSRRTADASGVQLPVFYSYTDRNKVHIPNSIVVYANSGNNDDFASLVTGTAKDQTSIDAYLEIKDVYIAEDITTQGNADLLAAAILSKVTAETVLGIGVVPHHCGVELYDKVSFVDARVSSDTYPSDGVARVGALKHSYRAGHYRLEITVGGVSATGDVARSVRGGPITFTDVEAKQAEVVLRSSPVGFIYDPMEPKPRPRTPTLREYYEEIGSQDDYVPGIPDPQSSTDLISDHEELVRRGLQPPLPDLRPKTPTLQEYFDELASQDPGIYVPPPRPPDPTHPLETAISPGDRPEQPFGGQLTVLPDLDPLIYTPEFKTIESVQNLPTVAPAIGPLLPSGRFFSPEANREQLQDFSRELVSAVVPGGRLLAALMPGGSLQQRLAAIFSRRRTATSTQYFEESDNQ